MTSEKAIEILKYIDEAETIMWNSDHYAALKLGIEALKRHQDTQTFNFSGYGKLLPGETKD